MPRIELDPGGKQTSVQIRTLPGTSCLSAFRRVDEDDRGALALPANANVAMVFRGVVQPIPSTQWDAAGSSVAADQCPV
jgi:hypothetical protein